MRFQRLHIPAFGPFTNLELSFPSAENDFHVIYGGNEAGKSSLLRAIRDLYLVFTVNPPTTSCTITRTFVSWGRLKTEQANAWSSSVAKGTRIRCWTGMENHCWTGHPAVSWQR